MLATDNILNSKSHFKCNEKITIAELFLNGHSRGENLTSKPNLTDKYFNEKSGFLNQKCTLVPIDQVTEIKSQRK